MLKQLRALTFSMTVHLCLSWWGFFLRDQAPALKISSIKWKIYPVISQERPNLFLLLKSSQVWTPSLKRNTPRSVFSLKWRKKPGECDFKGIEPVYLSGIVDDAEVSLIFQLAGLLELGVCALLLDKLFYKGLVRGLGEPALFIEQCQNSWRVCLRKY